MPSINGAGVAEGHAAIHAAGALLAQQRLVGVAVELVPRRGCVRSENPPVGSSRGNSMKPGWLTHLRPSSLLASLAADASQVVRVLLERGHDRLLLRQPFAA